MMYLLWPNVCFHLPGKWQLIIQQYTVDFKVHALIPLPPKLENFYLQKKHIQMPKGTDKNCNFSHDPMQRFYRSKPRMYLLL